MTLMLQAPVDLGEMIFHHTADACTLDFYPIGTWTIPGCHLTYPVASTLAPTKHLVWMIVAAVLVFVERGAQHLPAEGRGGPEGFLRGGRGHGPIRPE
jgi:hypothetical protein